MKPTSAALLVAIFIVSTLFFYLNHDSDLIKLQPKHLNNDNKFAVHEGASRGRNAFLFNKISSIFTLVDTPFLPDASSTVGSSIDYTYQLNDLIVSINMHNFMMSSWGCHQYEAMEIGFRVQMTDDTFLYRATYEHQELLIQTAKIDIEYLVSAGCGLHNSDQSQSNKDRCFLLKNLNLIRSAVLLSELDHTNIARLHGLCILKKSQVQDMMIQNKPINSAGVVVFHELAEPFDIELYKLSPFNRRLNICYQLLNLVQFLSNSPVGPVLVDSWSPNKLIMQGQVVKLQPLDGKLKFDEPQCYRGEDCNLQGINFAVPCRDGRCVGYNAKHNLFDLSNEVLIQLLSDPDVQVQEPAKLDELVSGLRRLTLSTKQAIYLVKKFMDDLGERNKMRPTIYNENDGMVIDTSHELASNIIINEIEDTDFTPRVVPPTHRSNESTLPVAVLPSLDVFEKHKDTDFSRKYNYECGSSKATWGCVVTTNSLESAAELCLHDAQCLSFVVIPDLKNPDLTLAVFKNDREDALAHLGVNSYTLKMDKLTALTRDTGCLSKIIHDHQERNKLKQQILIDAFKQDLWDDMKWEVAASDDPIIKATNFRRPKGGTSVTGGGQMNVQIHTREYGDVPALFLAKNGAEEYSSSQLATHQLDRLLGLFKTPPAVERVLNVGELLDAGFPVDVGGNKFDEFKQMKFADGSLLGVLVPLLEVWSVQHHVAVPRLDTITEAVTPFSAKQISDLEYLILGHLAAIPMPSKGHISSNGLLVFTKTDHAFVESNDEYLPYFNNCQFTSNILDVWRSLKRKSTCKLSKELESIGETMDLAPDFFRILDDTFAQLSQVIDACESRYGDVIICADCK